ncbi:hypothetical protein BCV69DRAFT_248472 [Microstroma glucosiphilum]|uniref:HotDog ACOT-type domain-containing protein n=1 Tax=Pseudomicrostroma glucosiphilum TaxID=1684307 RepID=A0A316U778_9BASI|nr:hypothetical protein BCV69DRAFT_248472 [Pseudomicrostroma glucosiphilum]PWN21090.1 hypothetical protein BCV69DRAFT_248472 [Pseudomicrostroma glucosiphilum]
MLLTRRLPRLRLNRSIGPPIHSTQSRTAPAAEQPCRCSSTLRASPLEETETVKTINKLLSQVRARNRPSSSSSEDLLTSRLPTRINTQTWIEYAKSQTATEKASAGGSGREEMLQQVEEMLRRPKRMHDSYVELQLPFSKDPQLADRYIATSGSIRLGKIFEDLDNLAGDIAYSHVLGGRPKAGDRKVPIFIVTASVDRLDLVVDSLEATCDYRLSGLPIFVGSSSMEVLVAIDQILPGKGSDGQAQTKTCLTGRFTMVTRNALTAKSQSIPPLELQAEDESKLFAFGEGHKQKKRREFEMALSRVPPTQQEARELHEQWLNDHDLLTAQSRDTVHAPTSTHAVIPVGPSETRLISTQHVHPQSRNVHMKVFGGFLMRQAYELAWMVGATFSRQPVKFLALDALSFHAPVPVGAMLSLTAQIDYTSAPQVRCDGGERCVGAIAVLAEVVDIEVGTRRRTNTFHFSFDLGGGQVTQRVSPVSYQESMAWIEGKRRVELGLELRRLYDGIGA